MKKENNVYMERKSGKFVAYDIRNELFYPLLIEGVKITNDEVFDKFNLVLTSDKKLYKFERNGSLFLPNANDFNLELIDTDVTDIDDHTYIKGNEWYFVSNEGIKLIMKSKEPFIMVASGDDDIAAITEHNFYYVYVDRDLNSAEFTGELGAICHISTDSKYVKMLNYDYYYMQHENGTVDKYDDNKIHKLSIPLVKEIFSGCVKLIDDTLLYVDYDFETQGEPILVTIPMKSHVTNLQQSVGHYGQPLLLLNDIVYQFETTTNSLNENYNPNKNPITSLKFIRRNVKNVFGTCGRIFFVV